MISYRNAQPSDYKSLADIHAKAFKDFFLTTLGTNFLRTYYLSCIKNNNTIAIVAHEENNGVIGFATGAMWSKGYNKNIILSNLLGFGWAFFKIFFTRPKAVMRLINNLAKNPNEDDKGDYAELLSIGILPDYKGKGLGKQMLIAFENEARTRGCKRVSLTTDSDNNDDVVGFYKKSGYEVFYELVTYPNRKMLKMIKTLNTEY